MDLFTTVNQELFTHKEIVSVSPEYISETKDNRAGDSDTYLEKKKKKTGITKSKSLFNIAVQTKSCLDIFVKLRDILALKNNNQTKIVIF